ncbi:unnamed protein product [Rotaria sp. Silwood1]|nr:unnamed protein product [Rotaria sp. Silwood1]
METFVIASQSLQSITDICRRAATNELKIILFELNLSESAYPVKVDENSVVFNLGTLFRLVSSDRTSDGVWHAQLEFANDVMQHIKNQLRSKIGHRLTWLTFGSYLNSLDPKNKIAEEYYHYLTNLASNGFSLPSIYNNMGLMFMINEMYEKALKLFHEALNSTFTSSSPTIEQQYSSTMDLSSSSDPLADGHNILVKMAEISYMQGDYTTAIACYQQVIDNTSDQKLFDFCQTRINSLSHFSNA